MSSLPQNPPILDMAVNDPAAIRAGTTNPVNAPGPPSEVAFTPDNAGAFLYVCQNLLNRPPATQRRFYAFLEENGFKDDILAVRFISKANLKELTFTDPDTGVVRKIMPYDYGQLVMWKEYTVYHAKQDRKLKTAADILSIDPDEFEEWTENYLINSLEEQPRYFSSSPVRLTSSNATPSTTSVTAPSTAVQVPPIVVHRTPTLPTLSTCMSTSSVLEDVHPPGDGELNNIDSPVVPILANNVNMCDRTNNETNTQQSLHWSFDLWGENIDVPAVESEADLSIDDKTELIIFDILEDIPDDCDPSENTIFLPLSNVETTIPIVDTPSFVFASDQCITNSETNGELDFKHYSEGKIFKNHEDFWCHLSYSFELPIQDHSTIYDMVIPEEPPVLLPPPEPPPLTSVSLTSIPTKWGDSYQEWGESNPTHC